VLSGCDQGSRTVGELIDTDARDRYFPAHNELSEEITRWFEQHPEAWMALQPGTFVEAENDTDYLDISG